MTEQPTRQIAPEEFLAVVDHELGNLVTVVIGLSSALERRWDTLDEVDRRDLARRTAAQAAELGTLLANLRTLRHGQATPAGDTIVDQNPSQTLTDLVEDLRHAAPEHQLVAAIEPSLPPMRLDAGRLGQVLRNLVTNAAKFAPRGSTVRLSAAVAGDRSLTITVEDTGPGIPTDRRDEVFDKFVQLDPTRSGTGLGLFISRAIIESLGGKIWIDQAPHGGCLACVTLPLAPP